MRHDNNGWITGQHEFKYFPVSPYALLLEWPRARDRSTLDKVNQLICKIKALNLTAILEYVPGYHSLMIYYKSTITHQEQLINQIEKIDLSQVDSSVESEPIIIKVNYSLDKAQDLRHVSEVLELSIDAIIEIHTKPIYDVHFLGFLPGFLYLGGLDERISIPRRANPRLRVPAGSVAIAAGQTGIYPVESPGGWHIIGHTNIQLFNPLKDPPCPIIAGLRVKFEAA